MMRVPLHILALVGVALLAVPILLAQQPMHRMTKAQKIANAMSAAPRGVASQATIMDLPASDTAPPAVLRPGTNGWVCYPTNPVHTGNDPMCVDKQWQQFISAVMAHKAPQTTAIGVGYMIAPGGGFGSNTDPFAKAPTAENQWGHDGPHIMIIVPDTTALAGLPTTRQEGSPFVMWAGTPYAHIMVPIPTKPATARARIP